jgi:hypothetical protein
MMPTSKVPSSATFGVPLTSPTSDASAVHHSVQRLSALYSGQIFVVESTQDDDRKLVVSWIPEWCLANYFGISSSTALRTLLRWNGPRFLSNRITGQGGNKPKVMVLLSNKRVNYGRTIRPNSWPSSF